MKKEQSKKLIEKLFKNAFDEGNFKTFVENLFSETAPGKEGGWQQGIYVYESFKSHIKKFKRVAQYIDNNDEILDVLIAEVTEPYKLERSRGHLRNFAIEYLKRKDDDRNSLMVAYYHPEYEDWRLSYIKVDYENFKDNKTGKIKNKEKVKSAKRYSFLVGKTEPSHTPQKQFFPLFIKDVFYRPTLDEIENIFSIEKVSEEFFEKYRDLFVKTKIELDKVLKKDKIVRDNFNEHNINTVDFAKKLLGQIVFLYFIQKKGWFGVEKGKDWGTGSKNYLRELLNKKHMPFDNFFNDILEPLFYEALRTDRSSNNDWFSHLKCRIPFLNGGLFDPIGNYDWVNTDIIIPDELFVNNNKTVEGDTGNGIFDIFDRYNFTVIENEPLEKEVAVDPELLGRAYEKFNAIRPDNFDEYKRILDTGNKSQENKFNKKYGVYYTPRDIVHYMCRQSIIYSLKEKFADKINYEEIDNIFNRIDFWNENENIAKEKKDNDVKNSKYKNDFGDVIRYSKEIDDFLENLFIVDPAVGSGAFPVGMMIEITKLRLFLNTLNNTAKSSYDIKRRCIEHSIYGVDIDKGAAEIAKLRLWLSLTVDETDFRNIKPLPNLDYKIVQGNSLIGYKHNLGETVKLKQINKMKESYFNETNFGNKDKLSQIIDTIINNFYKDSINTQGYNINFDFRIAFSEVFIKNQGFDIVIGNPPYVSTKGRSDTEKSDLKKVYEFADDLYVHFYFKGLDILADNKGILNFITSKTFWTIQTKRNLRKEALKYELLELFDTASPFDAMVDTSIMAIRKKVSENNPLTVKDGKKSLNEPLTYKIDKSVFKNAVNEVFFMPTKFNMEIYEKYSKEVKKLMDKWWEKISTSKNIEKNKKTLEKYRQSLKPGDITLLGLITEGGQGLATANNGKYVGVLSTTKFAENIRKSRPTKLFEAIRNIGIEEYAKITSKEKAEELLNSLSEFAIRELFDELKEKYGRDIFGQGYLFRIVSVQEIADLESLTDDEKANGITGNKTFVPYDKGDKNGNRWYAKTPYYIDWSRDNVQFLKNNSGKKGQGMPVVRNPKFYFREGFCWSDIHTVLLKSRLKMIGIHDVKSMSLFSLIDLIPDNYLILIINSTFMSFYDYVFVNNTSGFQINDARQIPIIIPTESELQRAESLFEAARRIKEQEFSGELSRQEVEKELSHIQEQVDKYVMELYGWGNKFE